MAQAGKRAFGQAGAYVLEERAAKRPPVGKASMPTKKEIPIDAQRPLVGLVDAPQTAPDPFGGLGRETFMQQHVHRKLHAQAVELSDSELSQLGKIGFKDQFRALIVVDPNNPSDLFEGLDRETYIETRVHRRLHAQVTSLTDEEVAELGRLSFNAQFTAFGMPAAPLKAPTIQVAGKGAGKLNHPQDQFRALVVVDPNNPSDHFEGLDRETYMETRVHRRLHAQAASLTDEELAELGRLSFNAQFTAFGLPPAPIKTPTIEVSGKGVGKLSHMQDIFGGMGRENYMAQRVHRKLHPQAVTLSDHELLELGKLSFNDQFPVLEERALGAQPVPTKGIGKGVILGKRLPVPDMFGGIGRENFMQQRVHRKLHSHAEALSDQELLELGRLSFNEQFPIIEEKAANGQLASVVERSATDMFGGFGGREVYMGQRVHRKLHAQAAALSDHDLLQLGRLSFSDQFPCLEESTMGFVDEQRQITDIFGGLGREGYMTQRVHRRLHAQARSLSDSELLELGKLSFNDQFPVFEQRAAFIGAPGVGPPFEEAAVQQS